MDSEDLSLDQCRKIAEAVQPMIGYLMRLQSVMIRRGFPAGDPLYGKVNTALESAREVIAYLRRNEPRPVIDFPGVRPDDTRAK
jgi:hypothetical protein